MKLKDALQDQSTKKVVKGPRCSVGVLLLHLDDDDAQALRECIDSDMQLTKIAAAIRETGVQMGAITISRHRRKLCLCDG